jgi:hypothetical protein
MGAFKIWANHVLLRGENLHFANQSDLESFSLISLTQPLFIFFTMSSPSFRKEPLARAGPGNEEEQHLLVPPQILAATEEV